MRSVDLAVLAVLAGTAWLSGLLVGFMLDAYAEGKAVKDTRRRLLAWLAEWPASAPVTEASDAAV